MRKETIGKVTKVYILLFAYSITHVVNYPLFRGIVPFFHACARAGRPNKNVSGLPCAVFGGKV